MFQTDKGVHHGPEEVGQHRRPLRQRLQQLLLRLIDHIVAGTPGNKEINGTNVDLFSFHSLWRKNKEFVRHPIHNRFLLEQSNNPHLRLWCCIPSFSFPSCHQPSSSRLGMGEGLWRMPMPSASGFTLAYNAERAGGFYDAFADFYLCNNWFS